MAKKTSRLTDKDFLSSPDPFMEGLFEGAVQKPITFGLSWSADVANYIGRIIVGYSQLEYYLFAMYAGVAETDPESSYIEFFNWRSIKNKQKLFEASIENQPASFKAPCGKIWKRMRSAAKLRTGIAHAHYVARNEKIYRIIIKGQAISYDEIKPTLFVETIKRYRILLLDMIFFLSLMEQRLPGCAEKLSQLPFPPNIPRRVTLENLAHPPQSILDQLKDSGTRLGFSWDDKLTPQAPDFQTWQGGYLITPWWTT